MTDSRGLMQLIALMKEGRVVAGSDAHSVGSSLGGSEILPDPYVPQMLHNGKK